MVVVGTYTGVVDVGVAGILHVWLATEFFTPLKLLKSVA